MFLQLLGYLATTFLAISLFVNNDLRFRWLNTFGNLSFIVYGISIHALPVIFTNALLLCINLFFLYRIYTRVEDFDIIEFAPDDKLIFKFLQFYQNDIPLFFPEFHPDKLRDNIRFMVVRDMVIANIFSARLSDDGTATVNINYTVEKFRDYKVGTFIFNKERNYLVSRGIRRIVYEGTINRSHVKFLYRMGFSQSLMNEKKVMMKILG